MRYCHFSVSPVNYFDSDSELTPAPNLKRTSASHDPQYTRYFADSDALMNSCFPRYILHRLYGNMLSFITFLVPIVLNNNKKFRSFKNKENIR